MKRNLVIIAEQMEIRANYDFQARQFKREHLHIEWFFLILRYFRGLVKRTDHFYRTEPERDSYNFL